MTVENLLNYGMKVLPSNDVKTLLSNVLEYNYNELLLHLSDEVQPALEIKYNKFIIRALSNEPIQYIVENVDFFGYKFIINKNVLIPRFETEELVENTIKYIQKHYNNNNIKIIDLGCGSGVIGITLKKKLNEVDITCLDISKKALEVAKRNADKLNVDINIVRGNMLESITEKYDVIISNPPYIGLDEVIDEKVQNNEPPIALYAGKDGFLYYEMILSKAKKVLNDKYLIAFEIGYKQKEKIVKLANKYLDNIKIDCLKDMAGKDRMIFIYNV